MNVGMLNSDALARAVRLHVEGKLSQAVLETRPFPHLIIENFFPGDVYSRILELNPFKTNVGREWMSKDSSRNVSGRTPYYARRQINFHENDRFEADPDSMQFWTGLKECFLGSEWFESLILKKYPEYFQLRFGDISLDPDFLGMFRKELFLQRHEIGYHIGPHTDVPTRVFTCIFSFAERPGFEQYGTELLAHKDRMVRCWGNDHYHMSDFVVRKIAEYKPNNFFLFFKTRQSFHSVTRITSDVPNQRYGMQFQFYEPSQGLLKDLSAPDLMATRHVQGETTVKRAKRALKVLLRRA